VLWMSDKTEKLNLFDVTNIIVGTVLETGIFITLSLTGGLGGPASIVGWLIALMVGIGALLAIACSEETELLGASRLARVLA